MTDASNNPSSLASKTVSASTRPSTSTDKENLPALDKQHRPSTAAAANALINDHPAINGMGNAATNGLPNALLVSTSIDTSTANASGHNALKTSASGGQAGTNSISNRSNAASKFRAETVRLPNNTAAPRREPLDRDALNNNDLIKKLESMNSNDRTKALGTNGGDRYVDDMSLVLSL